MERVPVAGAEAPYAPVHEGGASTRRRPVLVRGDKEARTTPHFRHAPGAGRPCVLRAAGWSARGGSASVGARGGGEVGRGGRARTEDSAGSTPLIDPGPSGVQSGARQRLRGARYPRAGRERGPRRAPPEPGRGRRLPTHALPSGAWTRAASPGASRYKCGASKRAAWPLTAGGAERNSLCSIRVRCESSPWLVGSPFLRPPPAIMTTVVPPRLSACAQLRGHRLSPCPRASRCAPAPIKSRRAESHAALRQHRPRHQHQQQLRARSRAAVVTRAEPAARSSDSAADSEAKAPAQGEANAEDNGEEEEAEEVDVDEEMSRIDRLLDLFVNELKSMDMLTSERRRRRRPLQVDRYLAKATVPAEFASVGQERIRTAFRDSMKKNPSDDLEALRVRPRSLASDRGGEPKH
eukprot:scaffold602_cov342-Prasinococcus_capsulatus_cf.AAC.3